MPQIIFTECVASSALSVVISFLAILAHTRLSRAYRCSWNSFKFFSQSVLCLYFVSSRERSWRHWACSRIHATRRILYASIPVFLFERVRRHTVARAMTIIFLWYARWRHGRSQGETKYSALSAVVILLVIPAHTRLISRVNGCSEDEEEIGEISGKFWLWRHRGSISGSLARQASVWAT